MRTDSLSQAGPCRVARNGRRRFTRAFEALERFEPASLRGSSGTPLGAPARGADHAQGEWNEHREGRPQTASTIGATKQDAHRAYERLRSLFGRIPSKQPIRPEWRRIEGGTQPKLHNCARTRREFISEKG